MSCRLLRLGYAPVLPEMFSHENFKSLYEPQCDMQIHRGYCTRDYQRNGSGDGGGDNRDVGVDKTKLIINYIPQFTTEQELATVFMKVGPIENLRIMRDTKTGYSFGFGFVKYSDPEHAAEAIQKINGMHFKEKRLKVSISRPPCQEMRNSNLYITNLPKTISEFEIDQMFGKYGDIVQRTVLKDKVTGTPRGVAFVRFSRGDEAQAAIANLDGKLFDNSYIPMRVRVAEDHGRQKAQYYFDYMNQCWFRGMNGNPFKGNSMCLRNMQQMTRNNTVSRSNRQAGPNRYTSMGAGDSVFQNPVFW